jgi:1-acyl-sn-glycerol-3-phosphate acyltransferase
VAVARAVLRSVKLVGYFVRFGVQLLLEQPKTRQAQAAWLHRFCSAAFAGMGVKLTVEGSFPARGAVISNHLSYADIVVFAALHPCVFCSKAEIRSWPVLGWMTTMAGTVYVERGRGGSAARAKGGMKAAAEAGLPVVFFPEGTTTNGDHTLPFRSGLLAQAMESEEPITVAFLTYTLDEDNGPGVTAREYVAWGDTTPMLTHIYRFLGLRGIHATVRFAEGPMAFSSNLLHRKVAAVEARTAMLELAAGVSTPVAVDR